MKVLNFFLAMQSNKEFYNLAKKIRCGEVLTYDERVAISEELDEKFPDLNMLFYECNSEEYNQLVGFIKNN